MAARLGSRWLVGGNGARHPPNAERWSFSGSP